MRKIFTLCTLLVSLVLTNRAFAQNANVTVSTGNTANGSWSGGTSGPYTFSPTANSAVIINTDIVNRLTGAGGYTKGNVTIVTTCSSCTDAGNITISNVITAANTNSVVPTLTFNAANNINVMANINLTGAAGTAGTAFPAAAAGVGGFGTNISLITNASGSIILDSASAVTISTTGGTGGAGAAGGGFAAGGAGGAGGNAGTITINAAGTYYMKNANSSLTANGGTGGAGGTGTTTGAAGAVGNASNISITGTGGISIVGNITATGTVNGNFTINDGNSTVTSGGGANNGQTAGVIAGGSLTKIGTGTFFIGGNNTYTGTTTITAGTLRPTNNTVVASTNGPFGNNAGGLILNGGAIESNVATFSRPITVTADGSRLDAYGAARTISSTITQTIAGTFNLNVGGTTAASAAGQILTLSGVIGNSSGTLSLTKVGTSEVALSAANTFGGGVILSSGTLDVNNASALGNVAGTFTIDSATTIDNTTSAAITTSNYPQLWNNNFTFRGTQALNLGTGTVTMNADIILTTTTNTLTVGGAINNSTRSLTKAGSGTLTFGSQAITLNNLTLSAGVLISTSGNLTLNGNFINNATFTHNGGTIIFNGNTAQTIGGSVVTTFNNLTANNTFGTSPQIILAKNETVAGTLTLTQGNIDAQTNSDTLYVSSNATGAISRTSGYVIGNLKRAITNTGSPAYTYYIGTSTGYTPVSLTFNTLSGTAGAIVGAAKIGDEPHICSSKINVGLTVNDYFIFTNNGVSFTNYSATFNYPSNNLDAGIVASGFVVGKYSGSSWTYPAISGTPSTTVTSISGATTFGNFAIGDTTANQISYMGGSFCVNNTNLQAVTLTGAQGGKYKSTAGLSVDSISGAINPGTSIPATYTVTYTIPAGICPAASVTTTVTIKALPAAGITNNSGTTILTCSTTSISATATGGTSYAWSGGTTTGTAANSFTSPNTYTVTVTSNGCSKDSSITITQNITPPSIGITNNTSTTILDCNTTTISVTATGGVSYLWTGGTSTAAATNTFSSPGTYTVTGIGSNGCSASKAITITQDITPPVIGITNNTGTNVLDCNNTSINVIATGGKTYAWSGGNNPNTAANLFTSPGTYSVTATGNNGCMASSSITITQNTTPPIVGITNNTGTTVLDCNNTSINVTATGGNTYAWSGGDSSSTANNTFSTPNTYSVSAKGSNGCSSIKTITITQDTLHPTIGMTNNTGTTVLNCSTTSISITATGGTSYTWSGGSNTASATNTFTSPNTYSLIVAGNNGCKTDSIFTITQDITTPTVSISNNTGTTLLNCDTTSISVTASGGGTYSWSGGSNTASASNTFTSPNTYSVTVTGSNGCSSSNAVAITQNISTPTVSIVNNTGATILDCTNTSISVTANGGGTYAWSGGSSPSTASNTFSSPATYSVIVTGSNGCSSTDTITITRDLTTTGITNNTGTTVLDCNVTSISVTATGGAPYSWSGGSSTNTAANTFTSPGTYTVTVTNNNGCNNQATITITQNTSVPIAGITNNTGKTQLDCNTSAINVTANGGVNYSWSGGNSTSTAANTFTISGTYSVTVSASNGCSATNTITITQDITTPTVSITNNTNKTLLTCTTTSISVTASGGGTYSWSGGANTTSASNVLTSPGKYIVTVTSSNGCYSNDSITITQDITPAGITNNTGSTVLDCNNSSINVTATGGSSYAWSGGTSPTTAVNTFTTVGSYSVTVTNSNGCANRASIAITKNITKPSAALTNNTGSTEINCNYAAISITAHGGGTYLWTGGSNTTSAINTFSSPGTYSVTVTGTNGCIAANGITITQDFTVPIVGITNNSGGATQIDCSHPTIMVTATGAATYVWSGGSNTAAATNTFSSYGSYNVTGIAANGCSASNSIFLTQDDTPPAVSITNNSGGNTELTCTNTSIDVIATGADSYVWSGGNSTITAADTLTSPGTYTVTGISASNGCSDTSTIVITQKITIPTIGITNNTGTTVLDCNNASINVTGSGNGSLSWSGGSTPSSATNSFTNSGTYTLTVTDVNNGCTSTANITITKNVYTPTLTITNNSATTVLTCTQTFINVTAGGSASNYSWSGGTTPSTATNVFTNAGTYSVTATGANGCTSTSSITITQNVVLPTISIANNSGTNTLTCGTSSIMLTASGANSYIWSGGGSTAANVNTFSTPGTYTVTGTDALGCSNTADVIISENIAPPAITIINNTGGATLLSNEHTAINVTATGGISYNWSGGDSTSTAGNNFTSAGTYTVVVIGYNGCSGSKTIQIQRLSVSNSLTSGSDTSCAGQYSSFTFSAVAANAGANPKYQWRVNGGNVGSNSSTYTSSSLNNGDVVDVIVTSLTTSLTATSNSVVMVINTTPAKPTIVQSGYTFMSSATTGNQWYLNGVAINGATAQFYPTTQPGFYSVQVTNGGCSSTSAVTSFATGIDQYSVSNNVSVYPNPFGQQTTLSLSDDVKNATARIVNLLGAIIKETNFSGKQITIERGDLQAGIYFIQVIENDKVIANQKVVVQ